MSAISDCTEGTISDRPTPLNTARPTAWPTVRIAPMASVATPQSSAPATITETRSQRSPRTPESGATAACVSARARLTVESTAGVATSAAPTGAYSDGSTASSPRSMTNMTKTATVVSTTRQSVCFSAFSEEEAGVRPPQQTREASLDRNPPPPPPLEPPGSPPNSELALWNLSALIALKSAGASSLLPPIFLVGDCGGGFTEFDVGEGEKREEEGREREREEKREREERKREKKERG
jgi:hypothetical protein